MQLCLSLLLIVPHCPKISALSSLPNLSKFCLTHFPSLASCHSFHAWCSYHLSVSWLSCLPYLCYSAPYLRNTFPPAAHLSKSYPSFQAQLKYHFFHKVPPYLSSCNRIITPTSEFPQHLDLLPEHTLHSACLFSLLNWVLHFHI